LDDNIGAWDGDCLVGCIRVLTDGYFFATIPEILVLPVYRRRGIGRELMRRAVEAAPRQRLFFGVQPESVAFFERIGCRLSLTGFEAFSPSPAQNR
jgi:GNAT superfamily N-acetyltransferase